MSLTGTTRRVAQIIGVLGGLLFALSGYNIIPTIFYYSGNNFGNYIYFILIGWVSIWFALGFWISYGLVGLVYKLIKNIWR